ncbi:unnamed protein product [Caenorhabditis nigoni]
MLPAQMRHTNSEVPSGLDALKKARMERSLEELEDLIEEVDLSEEEYQILEVCAGDPSQRRESRVNVGDPSQSMESRDEIGAPCQKSSSMQFFHMAMEIYKRRQRARIQRRREEQNEGYFKQRDVVIR